MKWLDKLLRRKPKRHIGAGIFDFIRNGHVYHYEPTWDKEAWDAAFLALHNSTAFKPLLYKDAWDAALKLPIPKFAQLKPIKMKTFIRPEVNHCKEWMSVALENPGAFYLILAKYVQIPDVQQLSIWDIFEKYSSGDRYGKWTILDFIKNEDGTFTFSEEDIATLSGSGSDRVWKIENEAAIFVKSENVWMS